MWRNKKNPQIWRPPQGSVYNNKGFRGFSPVALAYAKAQYCPFLDITPRPSVPDLISIPSEKRKLTMRGKLKCSAATGHGYIFLNPDLAVCDPSNVGDNTEANIHWLAPLWYTTAAFTGTGIPKIIDFTLTGTPVPSTTGTPGYYDQGVTPAKCREIQQNGFRTADWRCVGAGIRVKYIGPAEDRSGTVILYNSENNTGYQLDTAGMTEQQFLARNHLTTQVAVTEGEHCVLWHPRKPTDLGYQCTRLPSLINQAFEPYFSEGAGSIGMVFFGCRNSAGTQGGEFVYEVDAYYEFIGTDFQNKTKSDSDILGLSRIQGLMDAEVSPDPSSVQLGKKISDVLGKERKGKSGYKEDDPNAPWNQGMEMALRADPDGGNSFEDSTGMNKRRAGSLNPGGMDIH